MDVVDAGRVIELNEDTEATPASMSWLIVLSGTFERSCMGYDESKILFCICCCIINTKFFIPYKWE